MMESWRCLPFQTESAAHLLAIGDALLAGVAAAGQPAMCWYRAAAPALILGVGQPVQHIDQDACRAVGVSLHRRSSGGTAVLMTPDVLMLDVALPTGHHLCHADVTESYHWFGDVWQTALRAAGLRPRLLSVAEARSDTRTIHPLLKRVCFGGFSPYEVLVGERKIVGLAQVRRRSGVLFQAGIYMRWQPDKLVRLLALSPDERRVLADKLWSRATGLHQEQAQIDVDMLVSLFAAALGIMQQVVPVAAQWSQEEEDARLQAICRERKTGETKQPPSS